MGPPTVALLSATDGLPLTSSGLAALGMCHMGVHVVLEYLMLFFSLFLYFPNIGLLHIYAFEIVEGFIHVY